RKRAEREPGHRAVVRNPDRPTEVDEARVAHGTVRRSEDLRVEPARPEGPRQAGDVGLDAAPGAPGVGTDHRDARPTAHLAHVELAPRRPLTEKAAVIRRPII